MKKTITLDTGPVTLFFMEDVPEKIAILFNKIEKGEYIASVVPQVIAEAYKHICVRRGKIAAQASMAKVLTDYPITLVELNPSLIFKAGALKCNYREVFSYTDCFVIAYALLNDLEMHTTEKVFPKIPSLKIYKYDFS